MAKRTRAPARREVTPQSRRRTTDARKTAGKARCKAAQKSANAQTRQATLARRRTYTPELLAHVRHRFEQTEDSVTGIARDLGVSREGVRALAKREGWKRYVRPPRGLPPSVKLLTEAPNHQPHEQAGTQVADEEGIPPVADTIARLHRAVLDELAAIETIRKQSRRAGTSAHITRTLASLTDTLQKLHRLQPDHANPGPDDDEMPADIDEFRNELARRIEAFVAERTDAGDGRGPGAPSMDAAV